MTVARTLERLRPNDVVVDVQAEDVPPEVWTGAVNVGFRRNMAERVGGYAALFQTATEGPVHLRPLVTPLAPYWLYATDADKVFVTAGAAHFDITPTPVPAPTIKDAWTSTVLNGLAVMNDASSTPWYWNNQTGTPMVALPGWQAGHTCRVIRAYKNYLIAMAYNDGVSFIPDLLAWSDAAAPGSIPTEWLPSATNDAGFIAVSDQPGELLDGLVLRDQFMVYAKNAVYSLSFIGGNLIFALRQLFSTVGILARNCVVEVEGRHVVLTENDIVVHDGHTSTSLIDRRWRQFLFARLNLAAASASFVALYEAANEVWFCIPQSGDTWPTAALVWNYKEDRIGWREFDPVPHGAGGTLPAGTTTTIDQLAGSIDNLVGTIDGLSEVGGKVDQLVLAATDSNRFYHVDAANDLVGTDIVASLSRHSMDFGEPLRTKTIKGVWPRIEGGNGSFEVRIGRQAESYDPIAWGNWLPWTAGRVDTFATGRFISVELRSTGGSPWRCSGFDVEYSWRGRY